MAVIKLGDLTTFEGDASGSWLVMNDPTNTATYKVQREQLMSGYTPASASHALTASYVILAQTASYVEQSQTASYVLNAVSSSYSVTASYFIGGITGKGANGQVSYWTTTNTQTGSNNLFWDSTNTRLGVGGITSPLNRIHIRSGGLIQDSTNGDSFISIFYPYFDNILVGSSPYSTLAIKNRTTTGVSGIFLYNSSDEAGAVFGINNPSHPDAPNQLYFWNYLNAGIRFGANNAEKVRITPEGKLLVGITSSAFLLDVSGSGRFTNGLQVTGSLNATIITGSLFGTASWTLNSVTASFVTASNVYGPFGSNSTITSSYALTASYAINAEITSTFPYSGSATVSGSLIVTGSLQISGSGYINSASIVSSNTIQKIETITSASYAALNPPVNGTLYIIVD